MQNKFYCLKSEITFPLHHKNDLMALLPCQTKGDQGSNVTTHLSYAHAGVIKFFSQPLVQDKWPVKIHLS